MKAAFRITIRRFNTIGKYNTSKVMRITVSHKKTQAEMIPAVDRAMNEVFKGLEIGPIKVVNPQQRLERIDHEFLAYGEHGIHEGANRRHRGRYRQRRHH